MRLPDRPIWADGSAGAVDLAREVVRLAEMKGYRKILGHAQTRVAPFWIRHLNGRIRDNRASFQFSDHDYVEIVVDINPPANAISLDSDPMVVIRPEGEWDKVGILERSAARPSQLQAA